MAISITWETGVIFVPRADMPLVQSLPTEIRELNIDAFRLNLKTLEASEYGMTFLDTHTNTGEADLGGLTYARIIEIINGYTVTFEDGQYAVNLFGANSNIGDVVNVNQVSVRSQNSAGLISNKAIEFSSFNGGVTIDQTNSTGRASSGTVFPSGTPEAPCLYLTDLHLISQRRGFNKVWVLGNLLLDDTASWDGHEFVGESALKSVITIPAIADVLDCEFYDCNVTGTLDGSSQIERSVINELSFVDGFIFSCAIGPSTITLGTGTVANIFSCYSTVPGNATPTIDLAGNGILALRDYNGGIKLINYNSTGSHSVDLAAGQVILDSNTITSGIFVIRGVGKLVDENGVHIHSGAWNGVTIVNELINVPNIVEGTWDEPIINHLDSGSTGKALDDAASGSSLTPSEIADAVWDEPQADHLSAGSTGKSLSDGAVGTTPSEVADAVWDALLTVHIAPDTFGYAMNTILRDVSYNITSVEISGETILTIWENPAQTVIFKKYNIGTPESPKRIDVT